MPVALIPAGLKVLGGGLQAIFGGSKARKAQNALENLKTPTYDPNQAISSYYNNALSRYNMNPYQTQQYQVAQNNANRTLGAGLGALQDRRSAVGGIAKLSAINNDNMLKAGAMAENEQNRRFGQLGMATQLKASDDRYGFNINKMLPYQKQYSLLAQKASAGNQILGAGLNNIFGGIGDASEVVSNNMRYGYNPLGTKNKLLGLGANKENPYGSTASQGQPIY